jgi:predicted AAA+ superfamily ATPase
VELSYCYFMVPRYYDDLNKVFRPHRALMIYGPRRVGKTTLLQRFLAQTSLRTKLDSGDNLRTQLLFSSRDFNALFAFVEGYDLLAIDEAQRIPHIGEALKILTDHRPQLSIIATGSSSFDLSQAVGEPLTGRKHLITLYPIAQLELLSQLNKHELNERLNEFLVFGSYPDVVTAKSDRAKREVLDELVDSYLLKDVFSLERLRGSRVILDLLKLLSFQVGQEVSWNELATHVKMDVKTVGRYLDILEKAFVIKSLGGFSRNLRSEITQKQKYYFLDNGIRNAVISQYQPLSDRADVGALWENFLFVERMKKNSYHAISGPRYFWRTYTQQEIDFVEEHNGKLSAYECKWSPRSKSTPPSAWKGAYPEASYHIVHPGNYLDFVT